MSGKKRGLSFKAIKPAKDRMSQSCVGKRFAARCGLVVLLPIGCLYAQEMGKSPAPDILICKNGEKFVGRLLSSNDSSVVFKSDAAGQVTVDWSKVQELNSSTEFAAIPKGVKLHGAKDQNAIPQGTVAAADQRVQINPGPQDPPQTIPVKDVARLVNEDAFRRAFRRRNFFEGWEDKATVGIAYTDSTEKSQSYTAALNLISNVPNETWLDQKRRTLVNLYAEYGEISQPGTPATKISILHVDAEQDWYLHARLFAFVQAIGDHNFAQGLDLQQDYGGGLGFHVLRSDKQKLDAKAGVSYIHQHFTNSNQNNSLVGLTFGELYLYKFPRNITFTQTGNYIPARSNTRASSGDVDAQLTVPVYRRLGFTVGAVDNYVNDAPIGFKKNSFTITLGATYSIQ
jgi:putative salt-induced outer membrane protein YdiY